MYRFRKIRWLVSGLLKQFGLAKLVIVGAFLSFVPTVLLPPWHEVKCQRKELLYYTAHVKDSDHTFVGYDFVFAGPKWESPDSPIGTTPGETFIVTEYRIFWTLLLGEWIVIFVAACTLFVVLTRRLRVATEPNVADAVQPTAEKPPETSLL